MTFGPRKVYTRGSTTALFCPMSEPIGTTYEAGLVALRVDVRD